MKLKFCRSTKVMKSKSKQSRLMRVIDKISYVEINAHYQPGFTKGDLVSIGDNTFFVLGIA